MTSASLSSPALRIAAIRRSARRGFSLIELLIVIAILLAIGGLVAINLRPTQDQAKEDLVVNQMDRFEDALKLFQLHLDRFPTEEEGVTVLWSKSQLENEDDEAKWKGPYLEEPSAEDGWGNEWVYIFPSEERPGYYEIRSSGADGEPDTEDDLSSLDRFKDADGELDENFDDFSAEGDGATP
ncbi:MAG: type II secretion system major pseudopilin GspG [Phycisphaerales bacterium]